MSRDSSQVGSLLDYGTKGLLLNRINCILADQPKPCRPHQCSLSRKLASSEVERYQSLASRSIIGWSDRLFRPKHPVSKDDASIPDIPVLAMNTTTIRTPLVRILPPPQQNSMFSMEKRGFGDDSGDSLDDSPGAKAAHKTTQHLQAWTCMDRQESQSNWPEMRKTLGKPLV